MRPRAGVTGKKAMEYRKKCPVCGRDFTTNRELNMYCGPECRTAARRKRDREYKRTKRAAGAAARRQDREESSQARKERVDARSRAARDDFDRRCAAGDAHALILREKASGGNCSPRYWELFARLSIEDAESSGTTSRVLVNGHSVYEDTFAEDVAKSIKERGHVFIELAKR